MCDTFVALKNACAGGNTIFAKNSDRKPNEPHIMVKVPAKNYGELEMVRATYISIPQVKHTFACVLLKPSWIWGAEMGWNEHGLNIGNEAVFTKAKKGYQGLIGMDLLRLALERAKTCEEAINVITSLISKYGQDGNCGYKSKFYYHNSFLISTASEAYVLETAGKDWVAKKVENTYAISNELTIEKNFDMSRSGLMEDLLANNKIKHKNDLNFKQVYSNKFMTHFAKASKRRCQVQNAINSNLGYVTPNLAMNILRSHDKSKNKKMPYCSSVGSPCMHAGSLIGDQTTGSYVAELKQNPLNNVYWVTGCSFPCLSVYKPVFRNLSNVFYETELPLACDYWAKRELLHRHILSKNININEYKQEIYSLQEEFIKLVLKLDFNDSAKLEEVSNYCFKKENAMVKKYLEQCGNLPLKTKGGMLFKKQWNKYNNQFLEENNV